MMIPNLAIKKVTIPKRGDKNPTFKPPAKIAGEISPTSWIASKAVIKPINRPKNPQTIAKNPIDDNKAIIFFELLFLNKALKNKNTTIRKRINRGYIKKGPPSCKRSNKIDIYKVLKF